MATQLFQAYAGGSVLLTYNWSRFQSKILAENNISYLYLMFVWNIYLRYSLLPLRCQQEVILSEVEYFI